METKEEKNKVEELISDFSNLSDADSTIAWLEELESCGVYNYINHREKILEIFKSKGFYSGAKCTNIDDAEDVARWLIGQALACIEDGAEIRLVFLDFAKKWRTTFSRPNVDSYK